VEGDGGSSPPLALSLKSPPPISPDSSCSQRSYLQGDAKLRNHAIWKKPGFWAEALRDSVLAELHRSPAVNWLELGPEELRETVIGEPLLAGWPC
jgi:hypothetical protein